MAAPVPGTAGTPVKSFSAAGTLSVPFVTTVAGTFVIVAIEKELVATVTPPATWVELLTPVNTVTNVIQHHFFAKIAAGVDAANYVFTWTGTAPYAEAVALPISGAGTFYEAATGAVRSSSGATTPGVNLTTLGPDRLVVFSGANYNGGAWSGYTGGFTERYDGGTTLCMATNPVAVAGATGSITATCTASDFETALMVAILPPASFSVAPTMMPLLM